MIVFGPLVKRQKSAKESPVYYNYNFRLNNIQLANNQRYLYDWLVVDLHQNEKRFV